ncbi:MAG: hypothetical protein SF097_15870 [Acidobacteriota bacterium]|nr:hypothetical protein [Acidobacteriota bacterium]
MGEKFFAKHPDPTKQGVNISKVKYDTIRGAILAALANGKELTLKDLFAAVRKTMKGKFDGSISWYTTVVKLDLEAREVIERVPKSKPQRIRLK